MKHWFYEKNGTRAGPIAENDIREMIAKNILQMDTLVWTSDFGNDWRSIKETDLRSSISIDITTPPPLPSTSINNFYAWVIAFIPLLGFITETIANSAAQTETMSNINKYSWIIYIATYIFLAAADAAVLKKSGRETKKFIGMLWLVPVYLFKRAKYTKTSKAYFWTWIGTFFGTILLQMTISGSISNIVNGTMYWGTGIPECSSKPVINLVKNIYDTKLPIALMTGTKARDVFQISQESYDRSLGKRVCLGTVSTTAGSNITITFTVTLLGDDYYVELQPRL